MRPLTAILCVALIFSQGLTIAETNNGFKFYDDSLNQVFAEELRKSNVPFSVNLDGAIEYESTDQSLVARIVEKVLRENLDPMTHYDDPEFEAHFLRQMTSEKIPHKILTKQGKRWISWPDSYTKQVDRIRQAIWDLPSSPRGKTGESD